MIVPSYPPPPWSEIEDDVILDETPANKATWRTTGSGLDTWARVCEDDRISLRLNVKDDMSGFHLKSEVASPIEEPSVDEDLRNTPAMSIVVMVVGSRGDVQPYLALGRQLADEGHRVRIATHLAFESFVRDSNLEFYDIGGDPKQLMTYMVNNPGLVPGFKSMVNGDIGQKRDMLIEIMEGCWKACLRPCPRTGIPFVANAIISNPPAFAHVHCAEALGIPLHMSFTMPWCPTRSFPHPLVNVTSSNAEPGLNNVLSYAAAEYLTWKGIGDLVNAFRTKRLGLARLKGREGPSVMERLNVPWTYCMSAGLVPKPSDWKRNVDVVGFYFLSLASDYKPPPDLLRFLDDGPPPIYVGFGSVPVSDPVGMSELIFSATAQAGVRVLLSSGWAGLGEQTTLPPHVFRLGNVPHDWLFAEGRVSAVVHHGGAGTTAIGLANGCPTVVVWFFGDQEFWGNMIHRSGAGPKPIPHRQLTIRSLLDAILYALSPEAVGAAKELQRVIQSENGVRSGVESFYRHLPLRNMRCDLDRYLTAVWWHPGLKLKLSAFAATVLADKKLIRMDDLQFHRPIEYDPHIKITDPLTGTADALYWTVTHSMSAAAELIYSPIKGAAHTFVLAPRATGKVVQGLQRGFAHLPKLYGSDIRPPAQVKGWKSGFAEGGKSLVQGVYDGVVDLVREPVRGAQNGGGLEGAGKGFARGLVNAAVKPTAGALGFLVHPFEGAYRSVVGPSKKRKDGEHLGQRDALIALGMQEARKATFERRAEVERQFLLAKQK